MHVMTRKAAGALLGGEERMGEQQMGEQQGAAGRRQIHTQMQAQIQAAAPGGAREEGAAPCAACGRAPAMRASSVRAFPARRAFGRGAPGAGVRMPLADAASRAFAEDAVPAGIASVDAAPANTVPADATSATVAQARPAVPPGASMAYNAARAHAAAPLAPAWDETHAAGGAAFAATPAAPDPGNLACAITAITAAAPGDGGSARITAASGTPPTPATPTPGPAALIRAVAVCGGQTALASAIGVSQSHVWNWLSRARVPAEHCPAIERATRRAVRCEELRPDIDWGYLREVVRTQAPDAGPASPA